MTKSKKQLARDLEMQIRDARPFSTTFLFLKPGCESIGQETPLAAAVEKAMEVKFLLWAQSWLQPIADELRK